MQHKRWLVAGMILGALGMGWYLWGGDSASAFDEIVTTPRRSEVQEDRPTSPRPLPKEKIVTTPFPAEVPPRAPEALPPTELGTGWKGRLLHLDGRAAVDAPVSAYGPLKATAGYYQSGFRDATKTQVDGSFLLLLTEETLATQSLSATAVITAELSLANKNELQFYSSEEPLRRGQIVDLGDLILGRDGTTISGTVTDSLGAPIEGVGVRAIFTTGSAPGPTVFTDRNGSYRMAGLKFFGEVSQDHLRIMVENASQSFPGRSIEVDPQHHFVPLSGGTADFIVRVKERPQEVSLVLVTNSAEPLTRANIVFLDEERTMVQGHSGMQVPQELTAFPFGVLVSRALERGHTVEICESGKDRLARAPITFQKHESTDMWIGKAEIREWRRGVFITARIVDEDQKPVEGAYAVILANTLTPFEAPAYRFATSNTKGMIRLGPVFQSERFKLAVRHQGEFNVPIDVVADASPEKDLGDIAVGKP